MSLAEQLLKKVQKTGRMTYGEMCQLAVEEGYKVGTAERRMREHMEDKTVYAERKRSKRNTEYIAAYLAVPKIQTKVEYVYDPERNCMVERLVEV